MENRAGNLGNKAVAAHAGAGGQVTGALAAPKVHTPTLAGLRLQRFIGWVFCIPAYELIAFQLRRRGYVIENHRQIRQAYREAFARAKAAGAPLVVCANHLTFIDSCLMIWAFGSSGWFFRNYRAFTWNLPAGDFFKKKLIFRVVAYLNKCIFIHRDGDKQHKDTVLEHCRALVASGEVLTIFPEGRRSRTGRFEFERLTFGTGKLVAGLPGCQVLCIYVRARGQEGFLSYPAKHSRFRLDMKLITPAVTQTGRKAYFEVLQQVGETIRDLEQAHFANLPDVCPPR